MAHPLQLWSSQSVVALTSLRCALLCNTLNMTRVHVLHGPSQSVHACNLIKTSSQYSQSVTHAIVYFHINKSALWML